MLQADPRLRLITEPTIAEAMPPNNSHMDLSVGEPVKKRDTSELNESDAFRPNTIITMPAANSASPIPLFIMFLISCRDSPGGFQSFLLTVSKSRVVAVNTWVIHRPSMHGNRWSCRRAHNTMPLA